MSISPNSLLVKNPFRNAGHETGSSWVSCKPCHRYHNSDDDFSPVASIEIESHEIGRRYYAHMSESEVVNLLPALLACLEKSMRFKALREYFIHLSDEDAMEVMDALFGDQERLLKIAADLQCINNLDEVNEN